MTDYPYSVVIPARTLQEGDILATGGRVTAVRPGPGKTVRIQIHDQEGWAVEHMDGPVRIRDRTFGQRP